MSSKGPYVILTNGELLCLECRPDFDHCTCVELCTSCREPLYSEPVTTDVEGDNYHSECINKLFTP